MPGRKPTAVTEQELLAAFDTYDQHVDVVSALEWLFTDPAVEALPDTVAYFERFPRIAISKNVVLRPDFTVLFHDGSAIVGEIAKIAVHDNSVEKLCSQIGKYDGLRHIPNAAGGLTKVSQPDVLLLVDFEVGRAAVRRIIEERYLDPEHAYKPSQAPCVVQFSRDSSKYIFQRSADPANGRLSEPAERTPNIQGYFDNDLKAQASRFVHVKSRRGFINDPIPSLYLATHLVGRTWPTQFGSSTDNVVIDPAETASLLQSQYGASTVADVRAALDLLNMAGLASPNEDATWTVSRRPLSTRGERDIHKIIAERGVRPRKRAVPLVRKQVEPVSESDTLF